VTCPHCDEPVIAVREIERFYRFYVHRATHSPASGRVVVIGCKVEITKNVTKWSVSEYERARARHVEIETSRNGRAPAQP
jgi:hypothetical protein